MRIQFLRQCKRIYCVVISCFDFSLCKNPNMIWLCRFSTPHPKYRIAGNFQGRKLSRILWFVAIHKSFLHEIWGHGIHWRGKSEQSAKVFSAKIVFFTNSQKFSPSKVSRYTLRCASICMCVHVRVHETLHKPSNVANDAWIIQKWKPPVLTTTVCYTTIQCTTETHERVHTSLLFFGMWTSHSHPTWKTSLDLFNSIA